MLEELTKTLLTELADHLDTIQPQKFHMARWIIQTAKARTKLGNRINDGIEVTTNQLLGDEMACGTAGCAIGHAEYIPSWRQAGLRFTRDGVPAFAPTTPINKLLGRDATTPTNFNAINQLLKIDRNQSYYLFDSDHYPRFAQRDPQYVAAHIRQFVATDGSSTNR